MFDKLHDAEREREKIDNHDWEFVSAYLPIFADYLAIKISPFIWSGNEIWVLFIKKMFGCNVQLPIIVISERVKDIALKRVFIRGNLEI